MSTRRVAVVGVVYQVQPQPPEADNTRWFPAGAVTFGVEYRDVDPEALAATYASDPEAWAEIVANSPDGGFSDTGVSLHVNGAEDGHEYLRFDLFEDDPHYHYVWPSGDHNNVVPFDAVAYGDVYDFAFGRLRERLEAMLRQAHGDAVADRLDPAVQGPVIDEIEALARQVRDAQRAQSQAGTAAGA
jgi:hypothetical protein